jgi:hypothetical protein
MHGLTAKQVANEPGELTKVGTFSIILEAMDPGFKRLMELFEMALDPLKTAQWNRFTWWVGIRPTECSVPTCILKPFSDIKTWRTLSNLQLGPK